MRRAYAFDLLARIRDEHDAARLALAHTLRAFGSDVHLVRQFKERGLSIHDLRESSDHLEVTYVVRLFSQFEAVLLDYWRKGLKRKRIPAAQVLIDRIADRRGISPKHRGGAHDTREFRNRIVHDGLGVAMLSLQDCQSHLSRYLSWLPESW